MQQRSTKLSLSRVHESPSQKRTWKLQKCDSVLNLESLEIAFRSADAQNLFQFDSTNCILPLSLNYFRKKWYTLYLLHQSWREGMETFPSFGKEISADGIWRKQKNSPLKLIGNAWIFIWRNFCKEERTKLNFCGFHRSHFIFVEEDFCCNTWKMV